MSRLHYVKPAEVSTANCGQKKPPIKGVFKPLTTISFLLPTSLPRARLFALPLSPGYRLRRRIVFDRYRGLGKQHLFAYGPAEFHPFCFIKPSIDHRGLECQTPINRMVFNELPLSIDILTADIE